jgi:multidrug/hemolysin transport system ATP-binding protein
LDEPTTGLDPQTRKLLWNVVDTLRKQENMTVFLTTHYMEEAAEADYVIILDSGKIAAEGTPLALKNAYTGDFITLYGVDEGQVAKMNKPYEKVPNGYKITVSNTREATECIAQYPELFTDYEVVKGRMDDVFLAVTGKALQE